MAWGEGGSKGAVNLGALRAAMLKLPYDHYVGKVDVEDRAQLPRTATHAEKMGPLLVCPHGSRIARNPISKGRGRRRGSQGRAVILGPHEPHALRACPPGTPYAAQLYQPVERTPCPPLG
jgi:hypothetical protein